MQQQLYMIQITITDAGASHLTTSLQFVVRCCYSSFVLQLQSPLMLALVMLLQLLLEVVLLIKVGQNITITAGASCHHKQPQAGFVMTVQMHHI